jgi:hypothetical protein
MKVSFDFDSTLSRKDVQEFATQLVKLEHEVWIVTSRFSEEEAMKKNWHWIKGQNKSLFDIANQCGIKSQNIHFTCMESKSIFLKDKGFTFHLDDDVVELFDILDSGDKCKAINVNQNEWKEDCLKLIKYKKT